VAGFIKGLYFANQVSLGKAHVVADALSRKPRGTLALLASIDPYLLKELGKL